MRCVDQGRGRAVLICKDGMKWIIHRDKSVSVISHQSLSKKIRMRHRKMVILIVCVTDFTVLEYQVAYSDKRMLYCSTTSATYPALHHILDLGSICIGRTRHYTELWFLNFFVRLHIHCIRVRAVAAGTCTVRLSFSDTTVHWQLATVIGISHATVTQVTRSASSRKNLLTSFACSSSHFRIQTALTRIDGNQ